jgi:hypothetical protein
LGWKQLRNANMLRMLGRYSSVLAWARCAQLNTFFLGSAAASASVA